MYIICSRVVLLGTLQKTLLGNVIPMLIYACGLHLLAVSLAAT